MDQLFKLLENKQAPIAVVGLGYVGLPLACLLAKKFKVVGFDISKRRIDELRDGIDTTKEIENLATLKQENLLYTTDPKALAECRVVIVAVPTPIDEYKKPDLGPVISASKIVGANMQVGTTVVFESTVYPGLTETVCKNELEASSGLKYQQDFFLGYSPERVNPGDREHTIDKITKVVAGCTFEVTALLEKIYGSVITAGIHTAPNIATAEAAKVIENTQRDINIALINELSIIFEKMGLDTLEVLKAAKTKWNFLDFKPGLVGGHCIGVDPYYLTYAAEGLGINPQVILSGRRINDQMGSFLGEKTLRLILGDNQNTSKRIDVAILGVTFKENVPDLRNTKVVDIATYLKSFGVNVHLCDPIADTEDFYHEYGLELTSWDKIPTCDAIIVAVAHQEIRNQYSIKRISEKLNNNKVLVDVKGLFDKGQAAESGLKVWCL